MAAANKIDPSQMTINQAIKMTAAKHVEQFAVKQGTESLKKMFQEASKQNKTG